MQFLLQGGYEFMIPDRILVHIHASWHLNRIMAPGSQAGKESTPETNQYDAGSGARNPAAGTWCLHP